MSTAKGSWKARSILQLLVDQHVVVTLGNGCSISFWLDTWVSTHPPLHIAFHNLFALSLAKEAMVFELWNMLEGVGISNFAGISMNWRPMNRLSSHFCLPIINPYNPMPSGSLLTFAYQSSTPTIQ